MTVSGVSPTINVQPVSTFACQNGAANFVIAATPDGPYQWLVSEDGGATWSAITAAGTGPTYSGWTSNTLGLTAVNVDNDGFLYQCMAGCNPSSTVTLTVQPGALAGATDNGSCTAPAVIPLTASGAAAGEDYKWYAAPTGGVPLQTGGAIYNANVGVTTTFYVAIYNTGSGCESYPRTPITAEIYTAPTITDQPDNITVNEGDGTSFSVTATGGAVTYQWQISTNGGGSWANISAAGSAPTYSGWNTATLALTGTVLANNGYQYRCICTACSSPVTSSAAILSVTNLPEIFIHPTVGLQSTYIGSCMENTCNASYYDDGGAAAAYSANVNNIFRTFCPNQPLKAVRATINSMAVENGVGTCPDLFYIQNGPGQGSPNIWAGCGTYPGTVLTAAGAWSTTFTSTHISGCLTFRFASNATTNWDGWNITLSCADFPSGPSGTANTDCVNATPICSDISASSFTYGPGLTSDACSGCVTSEYFTEWYWIRIATGGTVELEIVPNGVSDLDFAFFQANNCGSLGVPVRCSYAARQAPGKTGLREAPGTLDFSEDVSGDQWVQEINVSAGDVFYLMINEWDKPNPNQYSLDWTLTNGASFDCSITEPLPVSFIDLYGERVNDIVKVNWATATETNNDHFMVERSDNGFGWEPIGKVDGAGNSNSVRSYTFDDLYPVDGISYYRIKQTDFDGKFTYSNTIAINYDLILENAIEVNLYPNPAQDYVKIQTNRFLVAKPFKIYNVFGTLVAEGTLDGVSSRISLENFSSGMYIFSMDGAAKTKFYVTE
jgi:hypothetical protein